MNYTDVLYEVSEGIATITIKIIDFSSFFLRRFSTERIGNPLLFPHFCQICRYPPSTLFVFFQVRGARFGFLGHLHCTFRSTIFLFNLLLSKSTSHRIFRCFVLVDQWGYAFRITRCIHVTHVATLSFQFLFVFFSSDFLFEQFQTPFLRMCHRFE